MEQGAPTNRIVTVYNDGLSKDELDAMIYDYRDQGYKSVTVRQRSDLARTSEFSHCYEFELGRKT